MLEAKVGDLHGSGFCHERLMLSELEGLQASLLAALHMRLSIQVVLRFHQHLICREPL